LLAREKIRWGTSSSSILGKGDVRGGKKGDAARGNARQFREGRKREGKEQMKRRLFCTPSTISFLRKKEERMKEKEDVSQNFLGKGGKEREKGEVSFFNGMIKKKKRGNRG